MLITIEDLRTNGNISRIGFVNDGEPFQYTKCNTKKIKTKSEVLQTFLQA